MDGLFEVLGYVSSLGLGAFLGVLAKHFLDKNLKNRELLFHARRSAYSAVRGRLSNFFLEEDTRGLDTATLASRINTFFSEAHLLASERLSSKIGDYSKNVVLFHDVLTQKDEQQMEDLHAQLSKLADEISELMRSELGIK